MELPAFAAFFALLGFAALVIGVHDFSISSAGLGVTAVSLALLAFGVVLAFAALHLADLALLSESGATTRPKCKARVLVACALTGVLGVYVFLSAIGTPSAQRPVVVIVSLLLVAVAVLGARLLTSGAGLG